MVELGAVLNFGVNFCGLKENVARKVKNFQDKSEAVIPDEEKIRYITSDEYNLFTSVIDKLVFKVFFAVRPSGRTGIARWGTGLERNPVG